MWKCSPWGPEIISVLRVQRNLRTLEAMRSGCESWMRGMPSTRPEWSWVPSEDWAGRALNWPVLGEALNCWRWCTSFCGPTCVTASLWKSPSRVESGLDNKLDFSPSNTTVNHHHRHQVYINKDILGNIIESWSLASSPSSPSPTPPSSSSSSLASSSTSSPSSSSPPPSSPSPLPSSSSLSSSSLSSSMSSLSSPWSS